MRITAHATRHFPAEIACPRISVSVCFLLSLSFFFQLFAIINARSLVLLTKDVRSKRLDLMRMMNEVGNWTSEYFTARAPQVQLLHLKHENVETFLKTRGFALYDERDCCEV